jgi:hypothetical protein
MNIEPQIEHAQPPSAVNTRGYFDRLGDAPLDDHRFFSAPRTDCIANKRRAKSCFSTFFSSFPVFEVLVAASK